MSQTAQNSKGVTIDAQQLQELRAYLGEQPAKVVNPIFTFLAQLEAQQNGVSHQPAASGPIAKAENENQNSVSNPEPKTLKKAK